MAKTNCKLLRTLLEIHRRGLDVLSPADLHSVIVEVPVPPRLTDAEKEDFLAQFPDSEGDPEDLMESLRSRAFAEWQDNPRAGDPSFLPLPPRLCRNARLE